MKEASIVASALYLDRPFFGSRRMAVTLAVGRTRIRRLMRILAIEAHYPKRNLSRPIRTAELGLEIPHESQLGHDSPQ
jgi:hypothetical protein